MSWIIHPFRAPKPCVVLDYDYCVLCRRRYSQLFKHHIFGFADWRHNSVHNIVFLCHRCHFYKAHDGSWTFSISSRNAYSHLSHSPNDEFTSYSMNNVRVVAKKLWLLNPYNRYLRLPDRVDREVKLDKNGKIFTGRWVTIPMSKKIENAVLDDINRSEDDVVMSRRKVELKKLTKNELIKKIIEIKQNKYSKKDLGFHFGCKE